MKLCSIRLNNVRRFTQPVEITGIGPGLNVLSAPNENGKSTLFDALHALFFYDAKSWKQKEAAALAPHAGGNPEISAEIELDGVSYRLSKTFTKAASKGDVTVHRAGHLFKQADEAEAWIRSLIKAPKDGGPAGLLWVRQGLTTLQAAKEDDTLAARRDLLSSVAGEIEEVTGGRQMEAIRAALKTDLERYVTKTGKVSANGLLGQAQQAVAELKQTMDELAGKVSGLHAKLVERRQLTGEKASLTDPETTKLHQDNLQKAIAQLEAAETYQGQLSAADAAVKTAELALKGHRARLSFLSERIGECDEAEAELSTATQAITSQEAELINASEHFKQAQDQEKSAATKLSQARKTLEAVREMTANQLGLKRRSEVMERLTEAQKLTAQLSEARKAITVAPTPAKMTTLEAEWQRLDLLQRSHNAAAAAITIRYDPGQEGRVTLNAAPLPEGARTALPDGGDLVIEGLGVLRLDPAELGDADQLTKAQQGFDAALSAIGFDTVLAARAAARQRDIEQANLDRYTALLQIAAPEGIDALSRELATLPERDTSAQDLPSRAAADAEVSAAETVHSITLATLEGARTTRDTLQGKILVAREKQGNAQSRLDRALAALEARDVAEAERAQLTQLSPELEYQVTSALQQRQSLNADAPDLELAKAGALRAQGVVERSRARLHEIDTLLARLEALIDHEADLAVEEKLTEVEGRLRTAENHEAYVGQELQALQRLDAALAAAQSEARDAYIGPILQELRPLLRMVLPGAELKLDAESVLPTGLIRPEGEDSYEQLSGGTQEQIALLVRLAFARLLAKAGTPAPVILDDAIVYTDDDRIERMFNALTQQAGDLQIIILSCRQKVFRGLGGQSLSIQPATHTVST